MTAINQKEYLKKYLSIGKDPGKKKKKKKLKPTSARVKIIDDDIDDCLFSGNLEDDLFGLMEDAPQIVGVIDDRPLHLRIDDYRKSDLWKPIQSSEIVEDEKDQDTNINKSKLSVIKGLKELPSKSNDNLPLRQMLSKSIDGKNVHLLKNLIETGHGSSSSYKNIHRSSLGKSRFDISPPRQRNKHDSSNDESPQRKINKGQDDNSPPRSRNKYTMSDSSPPRRRNNKDDISPPKTKSRFRDDNSPPRKRNYSSIDNSPLRNKNKLRKTDNSPPRRKNYAGEDSSPPRRKIDTRDDSSLSRRRNDAREDRSPPRRRNNVREDSSPPRRRNNAKEDSSPPRRRNNAREDSSPPRKRNRIIEENSSPSRHKNKLRGNDDCSPWINRNKTRSDGSSILTLEAKDRETSPSRNKSKTRDNTMSPPRRLNKFQSDESRSGTSSNALDKVREWDQDIRSNRHNSEKNSDQLETKKMMKTLDGKTAGLQNARDLVTETRAFRQRENELFSNMSAEVSGVNAQTIKRNRNTGKVRDTAKEAEEQREKQMREKETKEKYTRWGKGLKQVEDQNEKVAQDLYEMTKPLARYADDEDLERHLKEKEREGDPMLAYLRKKKKKDIVTSGKPITPQFEGEFMPNRFGIRPGHRWDGVDRSNGYEKKWIQVQNAKHAQQEEIYKWSTEDM